MHKVKQSALPYHVLSADVLQSGLKPKKGMESDLWAAILAPDSRKKHWYIMRKIHFFLCRLADAKRLRKKVNLANMAQQYRPADDAMMAWCMACVFSHYLAAWQTMMSQLAVEALIERYGRGYLDVELQEKARAMNPNLAANDFRFLVDVGVKAQKHQNNSYFCF